MCFQIVTSSYHRYIHKHDAVRKVCTPSPQSPYQLLSLAIVSGTVCLSITISSCSTALPFAKPVVGRWDFLPSFSTDRQLYSLIMVRITGNTKQPKNGFTIVDVSRSARVSHTLQWHCRDLFLPVHRQTLEWNLQSVGTYHLIFGTAPSYSCSPTRMRSVSAPVDQSFEAAAGGQKEKKWLENGFCRSCKLPSPSYPVDQPQHFQPHGITTSTAKHLLEPHRNTTRARSLPSNPFFTH